VAVLPGRRRRRHLKSQCDCSAMHRMNLMAIQHVLSARWRNLVSDVIQARKEPRRVTHSLLSSTMVKGQGAVLAKIMLREGWDLTFLVICLIAPPRLCGQFGTVIACTGRRRSLFLPKPSLSIGQGTSI
jgi:hypothetical protein